MFRKKKGLDDETVKNMTVALIGCGPAGMNFLHQVQTRKNNGKTVPIVTCYERAPCAGGMWRDVPDDDKGRTKEANQYLMYEDMWCNIPKELMEYHDYTFDDHFRRGTPSFIPRKDMLEYMLARNSVDGALNEVKFNHSVQCVNFNQSTQMFAVTVIDENSGNIFYKEFDKCVWAAGMHGTPFKPDDVLTVLNDYTGKVLHSAEATENFTSHVEGKRVLIIGDGASAEDLALRSIKLDAKHVFVCARSGNGEASDTAAWPHDLVTVIHGPPCKVINSGTGFKCHPVYWSEKRSRYRKDDDELPVKVKHIDTVIMATGYDMNVDFLHESLEIDDEKQWSITKGWYMENNSLSISIGKKQPSRALDVGSTCFPGIYRGIRTSNPNMMFIHENQDSLSPILDLDVMANLVLAFLVGEQKIPKETEMIDANQKQLEAEMQVPWLRLVMDKAYYEEVNELPDRHWSNNDDDERTVGLNKMRIEFIVRRLARDMKDGKYPVSFGDWKDTNKDGKKFSEVAYAAERTRTTVKGGTSTYRDTNRNDLVSIFTGSKGTILPGFWLDLKSDHGEGTTIASVK